MSAAAFSLRSIFLAFAVLALIAGLLLWLGADDTEDWFSWPIQPPLTAAALGAYYWGACALLVTAARGSGWGARRPVAWPVLAIAAVLLAVTLVHLDKFDLDSLFGVFWLCAYIAAPPLLIAGILRERRAPDRGALSTLLSPALRGALAFEGAVLAAAAVLLLLAPESAGDLWPWTLTPLTSRALGAFALGVALVALMVVRDGALVGFRGTALAFALLGALQLLAVAVHSEDLGADDAGSAVYLVFWGLVSATGCYGLIAARAASRS